MNISDTQLGHFLFEMLEIPMTQCLALDFQTGRYNMKEILVRPDTDLTNILTFDKPNPHREHDIWITIISNQSTRVTFQGVPLSVPNEELLYLCSLHGDVKDGVVHTTSLRLGGKNKVSLPSSTRWIEVNLTPGNPLKNYYWMTGPGQGDRGRRVTVIHNNQGPKQCHHCLKHAPPNASAPLLASHCQKGGNGKMCKESKTPRAKMSNYIQKLKEEGYVPLRTRYYDEMQSSFPALNRKQPQVHQDLNQVDIIEQQTDQVDNEDPGHQVEQGAKDSPLVNSTEPPVKAPTEPPPTNADGTNNVTGSDDPSENDFDEDIL